jgi:4-hydroxythreonine-4-phosphate dehydrogenase
VLGLNPHAGEDGLLGMEEKQVISPVISDFKNRGQLIYGPFPADGFFGTLAYQKFDAVLAMYHDQGLIPFKLIAFEKGVNYTAGLPFVRTSPDHGTAYNIAGKNKASEESLREAIYLACDIVRNRSQKVENQIRVNKNIEVEQGED